jgi:hypothetical protein
MYQSAYDRILAANLRDFESNIKETVGRQFSRMLEAFQAGEETKIPIIGGQLPPPEYRTPEFYDELQATLVRALCTQKWCESECPSWLNPLPLKEEDCIALLNIPDDEQRWGRNWLRSEYARHLRSLGWHLEWAIPFEKFCAQKYNTGSAPTFGVRKRGRPKKFPARRFL